MPARMTSPAMAGNADISVTSVKTKNSNALYAFDEFPFCF